MSCLPGCTACCGHVPWTEEEQERVGFDVYNIHSLKCPFLGEGGCTVYEERPLTCRMFGVTEGIECPRGARVSKMLTKEEAADIYREYSKGFK